MDERDTRIRLSVILRGATETVIQRVVAKAASRDRPDRESVLRELDVLAGQLGRALVALARPGRCADYSASPRPSSRSRSSLMPK